MKTYDTTVQMSILQTLHAAYTYIRSEPATPATKIDPNNNRRVVRLLRTRSPANANTNASSQPFPPNATQTVRRSSIDPEFTSEELLLELLDSQPQPLSLTEAGPTNHEATSEQPNEFSHTTKITESTQDTVKQALSLLNNTLNIEQKTNPTSWDIEAINTESLKLTSNIQACLNALDGMGILKEDLTSPVQITMNESQIDEIFTAMEQLYARLLKQKKIYTQKLLSYDTANLLEQHLKTISKFSKHLKTISKLYMSKIAGTDLTPKVRFTDDTLKKHDYFTLESLVPASRDTFDNAKSITPHSFTNKHDSLASNTLEPTSNPTIIRMRASAQRSDIEKDTARIKDTQRFLPLVSKETQRFLPLASYDQRDIKRPAQQKSKKDSNQPIKTRRQNNHWKP
jgi:hypothetical protein